MLSTSPNAALPVGYRKKIAGDLGAEAPKAAAGVLYVAPDGDVLLLRRSSAEANFAGHWALPGGGVDAGESPVEGALRESREEMGVDLDPAGMRPLDRRVTPTGSVFHTFARAVPDKFVPKLNAEHSGYAWAPLEQLPRPLHPAVEATLREQIGMADDMTPEEWTGLREGFLRWTAEEEAEGEHAEDDDLRDGAIGEGSALKRERQVRDNTERAAHDAALATIALDRDSVRSFDEDGRMRVATANISKACVNPYRGAEIPNAAALGLDPQKIYRLLRDPEELEKSAPTFDGVQILRKHIPVSADDHQPWDVVGTTMGPTSFDGTYLKSGLKFWERGAIEDIASDAKRELSCGYHYRADMTPGNFGGTPYDGVMRDIRGNHVALVKDGRAGPDVVVGDSMENLMSKPTRLAAVTLGLMAAAVAPLLAKDAKLELSKDLFTPLNSKNFKASKDKLLSGVRMALDGKLRHGLAVDASTEHVKTVLDALEGMAEGIDASASEEQHNAMEAAAHGESNLGIPKSVGQEFVNKDAGGNAEQLGAFLKSKGMDEADVKTACDMFPKAATDEDPEEKKKKEEADKAAADAAAALKAKDEEMKDMVKKPAMDEAIKAAVVEARKTERGIRVALDKVRPYVGEIPASMALDSADDVYRHAAVALGIKDAKTIHASALPTLIELQPRVGARPVERESRLGMDEATVSEATKIAPGIANIQIGV